MSGVSYECVPHLMNVQHSVVLIALKHPMAGKLAPEEIACQRAISLNSMKAADLGIIGVRASDRVGGCVKMAWTCCCR
jgi:hypothetical protein